MDYQGTKELPLIELGGEPELDRFEDGSMPQIFQLVEGLARKLRNVKRETGRVAGLTPPQYVVLGALSERDRQPLKDLADAAHCTRATITGIVDVLERKGLVTRQPNPDDRRSMLVVLTEEGRDLQRSTPTLDEALHGCCTGLSPGEATRLIRLLGKLDRSLTAWEGGP